MNNDLISRKAVIELIENCHVMEDAYCLVDFINELPISYDVDKVVKKLEDKIIGLQSLDTSEQIVDTAIKELQMALEIVKTGFEQ